MAFANFCYLRNSFKNAIVYSNLSFRILKNYWINFVIPNPKFYDLYCGNILLIDSSYKTRENSTTCYIFSNNLIPKNHEKQHLLFVFFINHN